MATRVGLMSMWGDAAVPDAFDVAVASGSACTDLAQCMPPGMPPSMTKHLSCD